MKAGSIGSCVVGVFAAVAAIAVSVGVAILANVPEVMRALSLPGWFSAVVPILATVLVVMVAVMAAVALVPRRWS